jgi:hypothetical protein
MDVSVKSGGFGAAAHSRTVLWALGGFLLVLAVGYAVSSQPDAVKSSLGLARGIVRLTSGGLHFFNSSFFFGFFKIIVYFYLFCVI